MKGITGLPTSSPVKIVCKIYKFGLRIILIILMKLTMRDFFFAVEPPCFKNEMGTQANIIHISETECGGTSLC